MERVIDEKIREESELHGERAGIAEVRRKILREEDVPILHEVNDKKTKLFLLR